MTTAQLVAVTFAGGVAKTGEAAKSGPIGFAVILILCVACYFLFKSMSKHLKKVREDFPPDEPRPPRVSATTVTPEPRTQVGPDAAPRPADAGETEPREQT